MLYEFCNKFHYLSTF